MFYLLFVCFQQTLLVYSYLRPSQRHYQVFEQIPDLIPVIFTLAITKMLPIILSTVAGRFLKQLWPFGFITTQRLAIVDKPLKFSPQEVLDKFNTRFLGVQITRVALQTFIDENFDKEGTELKSCKLSDWSDKPLALLSINDKTLREWALKLHNTWKPLCREVLLNEDRYSLIYLPNQFVVPGGRFLEYYYWDSLFVLKGLLASGLYGTARNMIENFAYLVKKYGFIPNGGRVYYLGRSQPPMLIPMLYEYYDKTHDIEFLALNIDAVEKELDFWNRNRLVKIAINNQEYEVYQYRANSNAPRPEAFKEDVELVKQFTKNEDKKRVWNNIASACESGWDFSSRWLSNPHDLSSVQITDIVEVDLNSFICWNLNILSYLFDELGNNDKAEEYRLRLGRFRAVFQKVFYVHNESGWFDYNWKTQQHNFEFYPSIATPLFTRCYHLMNHAQVENIFQKMDELGAFKFTGGIPTSMIENSGQQWDFPNGWSPLNLMIIQGLRQSESSKMQEKAFLLAQKWVLNNLRVFQKTGVMWEKYNVIGSSPEVGSGGEYTKKLAENFFRWTNGAILDLLTTYADRFDFSLLEAPSNCTENATDCKSLAPSSLVNNTLIFACMFITAYIIY
ncbi:Trehalase [Aphelenchoides bicaudatus]|nr:Trehalase [Aphelenchoides bicaudatus]